MRKGRTENGLRAAMEQEGLSGQSRMRRAGEGKPVSRRGSVEREKESQRAVEEASSEGRKSREPSRKCEQKKGSRGADKETASE